ncbi:MAG: HpcH/HpaI aldolase/citrate lyase family protein [Arenicellales bacterium]|jgi:(S)-citramalyl-CoA lyase|nr:CoA ester lyase [Gammaproteobacteria bacterium]NDA15242.1 CoA ester lyase [Gammaproteobacteria bacterium]NDG44650.1 CoA ester lyase [Gammaproteobacteria bacterium]
MSLAEYPAVRPRRSFIFAPAMRPELYPKALASGADIVCVELEDGVAPKDKDVARQNVLALFAKPQADDGVERMVRINCLRTAVGLKDVQAILDTNSPPPALMLPKVVSPEEVIWLDDLLTEAEKDIRIHIIIEMNEGLEAAFDIAHSSDRIDSLLFGGVDMAADLRCKNAWEPLLYARSRVVHAAASAGIDVIDVPYLDLEDMSGMSREAGLAKDLGFSGKGAIHPKQIAELNRIFTPSDDEIARAKKVISAFEEADTGLVVVDGKLIEKPVIREMQRILSIADRASPA